MALMKFVLFRKPRAVYLTHWILAFRDSLVALVIWVVHAFQKKSTRGIETPHKEIELVRERLKRLKRELE
jgi:phage-related protein